MTQTKKNYNCTQAELYAVCSLGWTNYSNNLAAFTGFKALYNAAYGTARIADVVAAQALPDEQTRNDASETLHIVLSQKATVCLNKWQDLKRYIVSAYAENLQKPKLEAAGSDYYREASQENWDVVKIMLVAAQQFITANLTSLTANNNMPTAFQTAFANAKTDFETTYTAFLVAQQNSGVQTQAKIIANNGIKDKLDLMFGDGQAIYRTDSEKIKLFTFDHVLGLISGPSAAGIKGTVSPASAIEKGVTVSITAQNKKVQASDDGKFSISGIKSGIITLDVSAPGFITQSITADVAVGTTVTKNVTLIPEAVVIAE